MEHDMVILKWRENCLRRASLMSEKIEKKSVAD